MSKRNQTLECTTSMIQFILILYEVTTGHSIYMKAEGSFGDEVE